MLRNYFQEDEYETYKSTDNLMFKSLELVCRLFKGKKDKGGMPYMDHLLEVYSGVRDYTEKVCALLHDVVEDTDVTFEKLREFGYDDEILLILSYLTKHKGEDYRDYIERIISSENIHVYNIKLSDLRHNMDINRIKNPTTNDYERITKRYAPAYERINNKLEELERRNLEIEERQNVRY